MVSHLANAYPLPRGAQNTEQLLYEEIHQHFPSSTAQPLHKTLFYFLVIFDAHVPFDL